MPSGASSAMRMIASSDSQRSRTAPGCSGAWCDQPIERSTSLTVLYSGSEAAVVTVAPRSSMSASFTSRSSKNRLDPRTIVETPSAPSAASSSWDCAFIR